MNKVLKILYVEDDAENRNELIEVLSRDTISGMEIQIEGEESFEAAIERCKNYHMVILDLFQGDATKGGTDEGSNVYKQVKENFFVPILFYSGNPISVDNLRSQVVGIVNKGSGVDVLKKEIERLLKHNLPFLRERVHKHIEDLFKGFFWNVIQQQNKIFTPEQDDYSLGYLMLRTFAHNLSKNNIKRILGDDTINDNKVHPMEFYIYPTDTTEEYENGEIIKDKQSSDVFVVLTPSCDFIERFKKSGESQGRKAVEVLLVKTILLTETNELKAYKENKSNGSRNNLIDRISPGKNDRYFFLPQAPFIKNSIIDFQKCKTISYDLLTTNFERVAKLDNPFAQSMVTSFIRYYDRIGFPDLDLDYVISQIDKE